MLGEGTAGRGSLGKSVCQQVAVFEMMLVAYLLGLAAGQGAIFSNVGDYKGVYT